MFSAFTKAHHHCPSCGEEFHHHRADDFPPYIVITIVGHIIVPLVLYVSVHYDLADWVHMAIWIPASLIMTFALMQPVKGTIIAYQWLIGMHGFEHSKHTLEAYKN